jgi:hypothetical protein
LNTSIRVIAGAYYSNNSSNYVNLEMPTASASNDYVMIEYVVGYDASLVFYSYQLQVIFPTSSNTHYQNPCTIVSYVWDGSGLIWAINDFRASTTTYLQ